MACEEIEPKKECGRGIVDIMPDMKPLPIPKGQLAKKKELLPAKQSDRTGIITAVKTPLGFFALVVLAVEAILGTTTVLSKLTESHQFIVVMCMVGILIGKMGCKQIINGICCHTYPILVTK